MAGVPAARHPLAHAFVPIAILTLIWGCNWPVLKLGVTELAPLTFRALTLPFAAFGLMLVAKWSGDSLARAARVVGARCDPRVLQHHWLECIRAVRPAATARWPQRHHRVHDADLGHVDRDGRAARAARPAQDRRPRARHAGHGRAAGRGHPPFRVDADRRAAPPVRRDHVGVRHRAAAQVEAADRAERAVRLADAGRLAAARHRRALLRPASAVVPCAPDRRRRGSRCSTTSSWRGRSRTGRGSRSRARCRSPCRRCRRCRCRWSACSPACCFSASAPARRSSSRSRW